MSGLHIFCIFTTFFCTALIRMAYCQEDKRVLKPQDLVNLIIEEQLRKELPLVWNQQFALGKIKSNSIKTPANTDETVTVHETEMIEESGDTPLKSKKVWSRWGKWGACSVTCGTGSVVRRRLCVAGRCAPGELEEQRLHCSRQPCQVPQSALPYELEEQD